MPVKNDRWILVMEVGGTTLRAGRFDPATRRLSDVVRGTTPRPAHGGSAEIEETLLAIGELASRVANVDGTSPDHVAIAFAGPVDAAGRVLATPTVTGPGAKPIDLRPRIAAWWPNAGITILNDLTAAGYRLLADGGPDNFCVLTVGSGIGHKVFFDGRPMVGPSGRGGELGHLRVDDRKDAMVCDCGGRGHLGGIASGRGALRLVRLAVATDPKGACSAIGTDDPAAVDNESIVAAFAEGSAWVIDALEPAVSHLGRALAAVHLAVGTEHFVLVGGFALAMGEPYRKLVADAAARSTWALGQDWDSMVQLGVVDDDYGLIGAGVVASL